MLLACDCMPGDFCSFIADPDGTQSCIKKADHPFDYPSDYRYLKDEKKKTKRLNRYVRILPASQVLQITGLPLESIAQYC